MRSGVKRGQKLPPDVLAELQARPWVSTRQLARILMMPPKAVSVWAGRNQIPARRIVRDWIIPTAALGDWEVPRAGRPYLLSKAQIGQVKTAVAQGADVEALRVLREALGLDYYAMRRYVLKIRRGEL